ncbi:hypothetical protein F4801DRAFT_172104 [Xylaria longipes]|nr:hypothetical protein F4801DRAFT_172104 [Xylaria longipes]
MQQECLARRHPWLWCFNPTKSVHGHIYVVASMTTILGFIEVTLALSQAYQTILLVIYLSRVLMILALSCPRHPKSAETFLCHPRIYAVFHAYTYL